MRVRRLERSEAYDGRGWNGTIEEINKIMTNGISSNALPT